MDALRSVKALAVETKFLNPVLCVFDKEVADGLCMRAIKIKRVAPFVFISFREPVIAELRQIVSVRSNVIVNNIENHADVVLVGVVYEMP